ncbi:MAG: FAD-dependent oxidoreductase [Lautropia sp.]
MNARDELPTRWDLIVVGAGPAGLAAATVGARSGLSTLLLDENPAPGGQVYRGIGASRFARHRQTLGEDYWHGERLVADLAASGATVLHRATVWSLDATLEVGVLVDDAARMLQAGHVIVATGALERPFPIPGWTLPGVMTAGAAQTLLKSSGLVADGATVLAGTGPLLWLLAAQTLRAGGRIRAILDTTPRANWREALPHLPAFARSPLFRKGLALLREVRGAVEVKTGVVSLEAVEGRARRLGSVAWSGASGRRELVEADQLLLHQGVVPNVNLAMAAGVEHRWDATQLCWRPVLDSDGATSIEGISIAGDGAGIAGAWVAEARGRLAACTAVRRAGSPPTALASVEADARSMLARHEQGRAFIDLLYRPATAFRVPAADDTIVCRCEEVTAGQIRDTVRLGCEGPNQMKAFLRCGMGPCQGRLCGLTVTELMAQARGVSPAQIGYYRLRPPVKPIALSALAAMPTDEASVKAVVR